VHIVTSARTGFPIVHLGRKITEEDVRCLEDDGQDDQAPLS